MSGLLPAVAGGVAAVPGALLPETLTVDAVRVLTVNGVLASNADNLLLRVV